MEITNSKEIFPPIGHYDDAVANMVSNLQKLEFETTYHDALELSAQYKYVEKKFQDGLLEAETAADLQCNLVDEMVELFETAQNHIPSGKELVRVEMSFEKSTLGEKTKIKALEALSQVLGISKEQLSIKVLSNG